MRAFYRLVLFLSMMAICVCGYVHQDKSKYHGSGELKRKKNRDNKPDEISSNSVFGDEDVLFDEQSGPNIEKEHDHFENFEKTGALKEKLNTFRSTIRRVSREAKGIISSEFEQVTIKATRPDDLPVKTKHIESLLQPSYILPSDLNVYLPIARKMWSKMKDSEWRVVMKALFVVHRLSRDGAVAHALNLKNSIESLSKQIDPKSGGKYKFFDLDQISFVVPPRWAPAGIQLQKQFISDYAYYVLHRAIAFGPGMFWLQGKSTLVESSLSSGITTKIEDAAVSAVAPAVENMNTWIEVLSELIDAGLKINCPIVGRTSGGVCRIATDDDIESDVCNEMGTCPIMMDAQIAVARDLWLFIEIAAAQMEMVMDDADSDEFIIAWYDFLCKYTGAVSDYVNNANKLVQPKSIYTTEEAVPDVSIAPRIIEKLREKIENNKKSDNESATSNKVEEDDNKS